LASEVDASSVDTDVEACDEGADDVLDALVEVALSSAVDVDASKVEVE